MTGRRITQKEKASTRAHTNHVFFSEIAPRVAVQTFRQHQLSIQSHAQAQAARNLYL